MAYRDLWRRNWPHTLQCVWAEILLDDCLGAAAQLAYYFLLGFFPFMIFIVALVGFLPVEGVVSNTIDLLALVMPEEALREVDRIIQKLSTTIVGIVQTHNWRLLLLSIVGSLFVASNGMRAIMVTLNRAYSVREGRPLWMRYGLAIGLTVALTGTVIVAALLLPFSHHLGEQIAVRHGSTWGTTWSIGSRCAGIAVLILIVELIYHLAPNVRRPWHWVTPGSILAVVLWLAGTKMFTLYVARFGRYELMYASLGAVVVFLLWLYIAGLALLLGGEMNAELERSAGVQMPAAMPAPETVDAAGHDSARRPQHSPPDGSAAAPGVLAPRRRRSL